MVAWVPATTPRLTTNSSGVPLAALAPDQTFSVATFSCIGSCMCRRMSLELLAGRAELSQRFINASSSLHGSVSIARMYPERVIQVLRE